VLLGSSHGTLLGVDLEFEPLLDEAGNALHDPLSRSVAAHAYVAIVRVAHEAVAASLQLPVQFIQRQIAQQRRKYLEM
jgi:hypothetical protein